MEKREKGGDLLMGRVVEKWVGEGLDGLFVIYDGVRLGFGGLSSGFGELFLSIYFAVSL